MLLVKPSAPRAVLRALAKAHFHPLRLGQCQTLTARHYAQHHSSEALKQKAKAASQSDKTYEIPERLIIYHAGTGRTAFLAMLKLTSLFIGAFFTCLVVPSYVKADKGPGDTAKVALCGIIPILFVAYTTSPFVTHIHVHLPAAARTSPSSLRRFVDAMPSSTRLTLTTMSFIAKPRYSSIRVGDLSPATARRRMGLVNYVRDTTAENASRKWFMYRAVGKFYVQDAAPVGAKDKGTVRYQKKKQKRTLVDAWIWDAVRDKIAKRPSAST